MMQSRSIPFLLLWLWITIAAVCWFVVPAEARRRDPHAESARLQDVHGRRLLEDNDNYEDETTSALLKGSTAGTRSLVGSNVHVPVATSPDDHLVTDLPLLDTKEFPSQHWAGLLPVNDKKDGYLFYWLFAPDPDALEQGKTKKLVNADESNVPLLIWLNGGPACSSMDGLWIENGPFRLDPGDSSTAAWNNIKLDPHSWHKAPAYTLYIDQPVGTGLAFTKSGKYPGNDQEVNQDFYYFLTEFMKLHAPTLNVQTQIHNNKQLLTLQRPFYFSGESHAGHYIPSMMNYIRQRNLELSKLANANGVLMPLSGAAIGNGWFDPVYQYSAHEAAYGYGLIGKAQERALAEREQNCRDDLAQQKYTSSVCFELLSAVTSNSLGKSNLQKVSQYDTRVWEDRKGARNFPPGHHDVEAYLGRTKTISNANIQKVLSAIHATSSWDAGQRYLECTDPPYFALQHQDGLGVVPDVVDLLEHTGDDEQDQIRLLFFNGIHDLICNHVGNENALENLPWKHRTDFIEAERGGWRASSTGRLGGYSKEFRNLNFLKVLNAGHMVPMDVPEVALDMITTFLYSSKWRGVFNNYAQNLDRSVESRDAHCPACPTCGSSHENCPSCEERDDDWTADPNVDGCTMTHCEESYDLFPYNSKDGSSPAPSTVSGILAGLATFVGLVMLVVGYQKCCSNNTRPGKVPYQKAGQIEMSDSQSQSQSHNINGYKDDGCEEEYGDVNGDDDEDGFDDETFQ